MSNLQNAGEVTETKAQERQGPGKSVAKAWGVFLGTVIFVLALQPRAAGDPLDNVADAVLGELDFAHSSRNTLAEDSVAYPSATAIDTSRSPEAVYVADTENSRVLVWLDAAAFSNGDNADLVIGQPDLLSAGCNSDGVSASSLCAPSGVAVDKAGNLYVADGYYNNHNRVLEYNDPSGTDQVADRVFGQGGDFTSNECNLGGISESSLCGPEGVAADGAGNLYVADSYNHRVLRFDSPVPSPDCGDGASQSEQGEECDDGNSVGGDGCDWTCRLEFCLALTPPAPPLPDPPYVKCQEAIALAGAKYGPARLKAVQKCLDRITKGRLSGDAEELCRGSFAGETPTLPTDTSTAGKISKAEAKVRSLIGGKCEDADAAALSSCGSTVSALGDCIVASHWRLADLLDRAEYMTPAFRDVAAAKCQKAIGKAGFVYVKKLLKAMRNCVNGVNDRTLPPSTDCLGSFDGNVYTPPGDPATTYAIAMAEAKARELIQGRCGDAEIARLDILDYATTVAEAETRLVCQHRNRVMNMVTTQYGPQP